MNKIILIFLLLFTCQLYSQFDKWRNWGRYQRWLSGDTTIVVGGDVTPPTAPTVVLAHNDLDSLDNTNNFNAANDIDSIFVRFGTSVPSSKTAGDSLYSGTDTTEANSITFAHGQSSTATIYVRVFVQDSTGNVSYGSASIVIDRTGPAAGSIVATGVLYDSVRIQYTAGTDEPGAYNMVRLQTLSAPSDTSDGTLKLNWQDYGSFDTTLYHNMIFGQSTGRYLSVFSKDSLNNVTQVTDTATILTTPVPTIASHVPDTLGTDSVEYNLSGYATIGSTINKVWIGMSYALIDPDSTTWGDSMTTSLDSVNTVHWAHGLTDNATLYFYVSVMNDDMTRTYPGGGKYFYIDSLSIPDMWTPDTFNTTPVLAFTAPLSFTVSWTPSEIEATDIDSLKLELFDSEYTGNEVKKTIVIPWSVSSVDSDTTFKKPVWFAYIDDVLNWGESDTVETTNLIVTLIDEAGNSSAADTISVGDTIYAEIPPILKQGLWAYNNGLSSFKFYYDTTGFSFKNSWILTLLDSADIYYTAASSIWLSGYAEDAYAEDNTTVTLSSLINNYLDSTYNSYPTWGSSSLTLSDGQYGVLTTFMRIDDDSIKITSDGVASTDTSWVADYHSFTASADTNGVDSVDITPISKFSTLTDSTKIYILTANSAPVSWDSSGIATSTFLDSINNWTYKHGLTYPGSLQYAYFGFLTTFGHVFWDSIDYFVPLPPEIGDTTRPDIVGDFVATAAPIHNLVLTEGTSVVSNYDDFDYFNVYFKANKIDNYVKIDTLNLFHSVENLRLPDLVFMNDSGFVIITAVDTNENETLLTNGLKDTLAFVPAYVYITFLTGVRGDPDYYWLHRNEADSTVSDSVKIPTAYVDTSLTDTCKVPLVPQDTLVTAYYALRTLKNDTLGIMSAWLKWPSAPVDDETPPTIAGAITTAFDSTYHIKVNITSVSCSDPDFALFNIYFKTSAKDSYVLQETDADINVGDRYVIDDTLSYNDSGFVQIKAVDDSSNISTSVVNDTFLTSPYFVLFETGGGRRVDINNVWVYLSKDSAAIADSFRIAMADIDTTSYGADSLDVPVSPPINGYGRYYSGRSDSSGTLTTRSAWQWYPQPALPDTFSADSVAYDTVLIKTHVYIAEATLRGTYNVRYKAGSHPTSITDGTSLYSGTDTSAINNDKFAIASVGGTTQYFSLFATKNGNTNTSSLLDTVTFPASPAASWSYSWTGDDLADSLDACHSGTCDSVAQQFLQGTISILDSGATYPGDNCVKITVHNSTLRCSTAAAIAASVDDSVGTVFMDVYILQYSAAGNNATVWEFSYDASNYMGCAIDDDGDIQLNWRDNGNPDLKLGTDNVSLTTWTRIGYSWDVANNYLAVKVGANAWQADNDTIEQWATNPDDMVIGELGSGGTFACRIYVDNVKIYHSYQATE